MIVTFTGPDDNTNIEDLINFQQKYSNTEFGILFGKDFIQLGQQFSGKARYPSIKWIQKLTSTQPYLNLSAHLCGPLVKSVLDNHSEFNRNTFFRFKRIQLNLGKYRLDEAIQKIEKLGNLAQDWNIELILAGPWQQGIVTYSNNISQLLDASGGHGITKLSWPKLSSNIKIGYAGGIGLDTIDKIIPNLLINKPDWIDMESKIRNQENKFDINICKQLMEKLSNVCL